MVGDVYSDIKISQLSTMLGLDAEQAIDAAISEGFKVTSPFLSSHPNWFRLDRWQRPRLCKAQSIQREEQIQQ